jgi:hypothetical protein
MAGIVSCCNNKNTFNATVNFEKVKAEKKSAEHALDSAYDVSVTYYSPTDAPKYLNDSILKNIKLLFASWLDVKGIFDLNASIRKHFDEYSKRVAENNPAKREAFVLHIAPKEMYQNEHTISFTYDWMIYEGGAHPNSGRYCFILDKNSGGKVNYKKLIKDEKEFLNVAETEFKSQSGIKADEKIYDVYWFKDKKFHLSENCVFTSEGLVFYYNPYEIAPYSFGIIELILPYEKIKHCLKIEN